MFICEFCVNISFANKANKKRHFLNKHNFEYRKSKSYNEVKSASTETTAIRVNDDIMKMFMEEEDQFATTETTTATRVNDDIIKMFMEEDQFATTETTTATRVNDDIIKMFMEEEEDQFATTETTTATQVNDDIIKMFMEEDDKFLLELSF